MILQHLGDKFTLRVLGFLQNPSAKHEKHPASCWSGECKIPPDNTSYFHCPWLLPRICS